MTNAREPRICEVCGKEFKPGWAKKKICNPCMVEMKNSVLNARGCKKDLEIVERLLYAYAHILHGSVTGPGFTKFYNRLLAESEGK